MRKTLSSRKTSGCINSKSGIQCIRLNEGLNLRVRDFDFDEGIVTIYGKGRKFRKVLLPQRVIPELKGHLERVKNIKQHPDQAWHRLL